MLREEKLAETLVSRFALAPPIDVLHLAERFADVEYDAIPTDCDGLVLGLQGQRSRPLIIVDDGVHETRQRFTLAHELGHVVLGWHLGANFACDTAGPAAWLASYYEGEANRFAAELLVPRAWLDDLIAARCDESVGDLVKKTLTAGVSTWVACLRLADRLPAGHVFAVVDSTNFVALSGQSRLTGIDPPPRGEPLDRGRLDDFATEIEEISLTNRRIIWWTYRGGSGTLAVPPGVAAEDLLGPLAERHGTADHPAAKVKERCSGIIGYAYGLAKRDHETDEQRLYARFRGRFARTRDLPPGFVADPDLDDWLRLRARELGD